MDHGYSGHLGAFHPHRFSRVQCLEFAVHLTPQPGSLREEQPGKPRRSEDGFLRGHREGDACFVPFSWPQTEEDFLFFFSKQMVFHFVSESEFTWVACHWRNQIVGVLFGAFTRSLTVSPAFRSKFGQLLVCSAHGWVSFHVPCHACQLANPLTTLSPFATGAAVSEREIRRLLPRALAAPLPVGAPCCRGARSGG